MNFCIIIIVWPVLKVVELPTL